jgi:hypothetical protein
VGQRYSGSDRGKCFVSRSGSDGFDRSLLTESRMRPNEVIYTDTGYVMRVMV